VGSIILQNPGTVDLLMGNEAIARGALEADVQMVASYPGTPSSEITEVLIEATKDTDLYAEWSINEKVAFEVAAGASLVGARSITVMKNAGLNVAMDTFMTLPYGGIKGGLVVVVADDPDAHYSSTEQDTRYAAEYAEIPVLEPEDQQEALEMAKAAFEISEQTKLPVFLRSVSRLSHASGNVTFGEIEKTNRKFGFNKHFEIPYRWNVYGPPKGALGKHIWLHETTLPLAQKAADESGFNTMTKPAGARIGVLASGLGAAYAREALASLGMTEQVAFLKLGFIHPLPAGLVEQFVDGLDHLIIVEEGDPVIERMVRVLLGKLCVKIRVSGKMFDGIFKPYGELNTDLVVGAVAPLLGKEAPVDSKAEIRGRFEAEIIPRSSTLCPGCSHLGTYSALRKALEKYPKDQIHIINGDIGCYEQGGYGVYSKRDKASEDDAKRHLMNSAYEMLDTIYVMGSGLSMAHGQSKVGYKDGKLVAVCGDSTFLHAILPALANVVYNNSDVTLILMDNRWTCMTGHQPNPSTGADSFGDPREQADFEAILKAFGIKSVTSVYSYDQEKMTAALSEAIEFPGPAVVIATGECQLQIQRRKKWQEPVTYVDPEVCIGCRRCLDIGCSAIQFDKVARKASIDKLLCVDCGLCSQICPYGAIKERK